MPAYLLPRFCKAVQIITFTPHTLSNVILNDYFIISNLSCIPNTQFYLTQPACKVSLLSQHHGLPWSLPREEQAPKQKEHILPPPHCHYHHLEVARSHCPPPRRTAEMSFCRDPQH